MPASPRRSLADDLMPESGRPRRRRLHRFLGAVVVLVTLGLLGWYATSLIPSPKPPPASPTPDETSLRTGDTGLRVTALQYLLADTGAADQPATGLFGPQTAAALRDFQTRQGLAANGIATPATMQALTREPVKEDAPYERRFRVKAAQTLLGMHNQPVAVIGDFDEQTTEAVETFQKAKQLHSNGVVDEATWAALFVGERTGPQTSEADQFLSALAPHARATKAEFGVPVAVSLAQSAQETGFGRSAPGNNYYGIKCFKQVRSPVKFDCADRKTVEWDAEGKKVDATESFRSYRSMGDSARDYGAFLRANSRYAPAFTKTEDPDAFARELQAAGYATDPAYADSLIALMKQKNLYQYAG